MDEGEIIILESSIKEIKRNGAAYLLMYMSSDCEIHYTVGGDSESNIMDLQRAIKKITQNIEL